MLSNSLRFSKTIVKLEVQILQIRDLDLSSKLCVFLSFNVVCQTFCNYIQYTVNNMLCDKVRTVYTVQFTVYKK